jgi:hypothetical protein
MPISMSYSFHSALLCNVRGRARNAKAVIRLLSLGAKGKGEAKSSRRLCIRVL